MTSTEELAPARPMRKDAARNRELLIVAAREVFARRGLDASLDDIAKHAGVGVGTAYRHFANKFELATAIMRQAIESLVAKADEAARAEDPWDGLVGFLEAALELQTADRGLREVLMGVHDPKETDEVFDMLVGPVNLLLDRAKAAGAVRPEAQTSDLGLMMMMLCLVADMSGDVSPELWKRYLPGLLASLRPDGPPMTGNPLDDVQFRAAAACHKMVTLNRTLTPGA